MPSAEETNNWFQFFLQLHPVLQGLFVAAAGSVLAYFAWNKFSKSYQSPTPIKTELLVSDTTQVTDLEPVRKLVANIDVLTLQMMKNEVALGSMTSSVGETRNQLLKAMSDSQQSLAASLGGLAVLLSSHLEYIQEERERQLDRERDQKMQDEGYRRAMEELAAAQPGIRRRAANRPAKKKALPGHPSG